MTNEELLNLFVPIVNFLGNVMGKNTEVVLHDVSKPVHSVIAIYNGFHSGRTVGSSMTDLALQIQSEESYKGQDFITNYKAKSRNHYFLSSTYYIKNKGDLIGMLCINTDTSSSAHVLTTVQQFIENFNLSPVETINAEPIKETLDVPIISLADSMIEKTIKKSGIPPQRMTRAEKQEVVRELNDQGVPLMKGAIAEIARQLNLSESTVYRYISQL